MRDEVPDCKLGTLAVGASAIISVTVRAGSAGTIANTATVDAFEDDPDFTRLQVTSFDGS